MAAIYPGMTNDEPELSILRMVDIQQRGWTDEGSTSYTIGVIDEKAFKGRFLNNRVEFIKALRRAVDCSLKGGVDIARFIKENGTVCFEAILTEKGIQEASKELLPFGLSIEEADPMLALKLNHDRFRRSLVRSVPQMPQRQDSAREQLVDLMAIGNRLGMYDAVDVIKNVLDKQ